MRSEWKVQKTYCCGDKFWQVYRTRNINETDHDGNREYADGIFNSAAEAQALAQRLNSEA